MKVLQFVEKIVPLLSNPHEKGDIYLTGNGKRFEIKGVTIHESQDVEILADRPEAIKEFLAMQDPSGTVVLITADPNEERVKKKCKYGVGMSYDQAIGNGYKMVRCRLQVYELIEVDPKI